MPMTENKKYSTFFLSYIFIPNRSYCSTIILLDKKAVKVQLFNLHKKICSAHYLKAAKRKPLTLRHT